MKKYIVDRLEGSLAVLEDEKKEMSHIERTLLPKEIFPGCILYEASGSYSIDWEETKQQKKRMKQKLKNLFED